MTDTEIFEAIKQLQGGIRSLYFTRNDIAQILGTSNKKVSELLDVYRNCILHTLEDRDNPSKFNWKNRGMLIDYDICYLSISSFAKHACLAVSVQIKNDLVAIWELIEKGGKFESAFKHCKDIFWKVEEMDNNDIAFVTYIHDNFGKYLTELPYNVFDNSDYDNYRWFF